MAKPLFSICCKLIAIVCLLAMVLFMSGCNSDDDSDGTQASYGGSKNDYLPRHGRRAMINTDEGGFIFVGNSDSTLESGLVGNGDSDCWVVKLSKEFKVEWQKLLGGTDDDSCVSVIQIGSGDYLIAAETNSNDGDVEGYKGGGDIWLIRLDNFGNMLWSKCYGGSMWDQPSQVIAVTGGFVVSGYTNSIDGDRSQGFGSVDGWLFKVDDDGELVWEASFGGQGRDYLYSVKECSDQGLLAVGMSTSTKGLFADNQGGSDIVAIKVDSTGNLVWGEIFGSDQDEHASAIVDDGSGYVLLGGVSVPDMNWNVGAAKISYDGEVLWYKNYGGSSSDEAFSGLVLDGDIYFAGESYSDDGDFPSNKGQCDYILGKLDSSGELQAVNNLGGSQRDSAGELLMDDDNVELPLVVAGWTQSDDGNVAKNHGETDAWLIRVGTDLKP